MNELTNPASTAVAPHLAPPGAGLPPLEMFFARLIFRWQARRTSSAAAAVTFVQEQAAILALIHRTPAAHLAQPVLIQRLPGLEDSSRYWSLLMVLDHLRIVNVQIAQVIASLLQDRLPARAASTAAVKPSPHVTPDVIATFDQACHQLSETVASHPAPALQTRLKFPHPWFGPLTAAHWHFMSAFHMRLHRRQMERISARLAK
ncbi:DinB family protein [Prosthecobacter sp. SYSU 5D2]|uniref:DinB family protein n=1 Tax=Prosthecobacter sp. SYSU 5D2 TaxID=3134134 RepID=UPI0031FE854B